MVTENTFIVLSWKDQVCFVRRHYNQCTSSYTRGDTGRDTSGDRARHTGRDTGQLKTQVMKILAWKIYCVLVISTFGSHLCMNRVSVGSATKTPTGQKRKRALSEIDINQINRKSITTLTHSDGDLVV